MEPSSRGELPTTPAEVLADVLAVLDLTDMPAGESGIPRFAATTTRRSLPFVFGGQLVAQALRAAYATVPMPLGVHNLHAHFLEAGDPCVPLTYEVETLRSRGSSHARRVVALQSGSPGSQPVVVLMASMSFSRDRPGLAHSRAPTSPLLADPERLRPLSEWLAPHRAALPAWWTGPMAFDLRYVEEPPHVLAAGSVPRAHQALWMRAAGELADDPRIHDCLLAFASDLTLLDAVLLAHARSWYDGRLRAASLDHSIWFHRPLRMDDWLLYEQTSPASGGGRGLATGDVFTRDGALCATVAQQGFISTQR